MLIDRTRNLITSHNQVNLVIIPAKNLFRQEAVARGTVVEPHIVSPAWKSAAQRAMAKSHEIHMAQGAAVHEATLKLKHGQ